MISYSDSDRMRQYIAAGWWTDDTLPTWLANHVATAPDRPAVVTHASSLSYRQLDEAVQRLARSLFHLGIHRGDVVAVQLPNSTEFLVAYLAISSIAAVMQTIHLPYRATELESLLRHSGAKAAITLSTVKDYPTAAVMLDLKRKLPGLEHIIVVGTPPHGALTFDSLRDTELADVRGQPPVASDAFLLLYTSGTTASPKGVPATYRSFLGNARLTAAEVGIDFHDRLLSAAPFTHLYGLYTIHLALSAGATLVLLPTFSPDEFAELVEHRQASALFTAPAHIASCLQSGLLDKNDWSSVRMAMVSGTMVPPALAHALETRLSRGKVVQLWGMSEIQVGCITRLSDPLDVRVATVGRPSPGTEIRVVDPHGVPVSSGHEGEIEVRGSSVFTGYRDNRAANETAFTADGWFRTGDLGVTDDSGNLRITGRTKDIINRGGVKFNPADIEELLSQHRAIHQAAVVPMPDPILGERACVFAVVEPGASITLAEICQYLEDHHIAKNTWPERLEIIDAMPLTPTRKVIKQRLRELL